MFKSVVILELAAFTFASRCNFKEEFPSLFRSCSELHAHWLDAPYELRRNLKSCDLNTIGIFLELKGSCSDAVDVHLAEQLFLKNIRYVDFKGNVTMGTNSVMNLSDVGFAKIGFINMGSYAALHVRTYWGSEKKVWLFNHLTLMDHSQIGITQGKYKREYRPPTFGKIIVRKYASVSVQSSSDLRSQLVNVGQNSTLVIKELIETTVDEIKADEHCNVNLSHINGSKLGDLSVGFNSEINFSNLKELTLEKIRTGSGAVVTASRLFHSNITRVNIADNSDWVIRKLNGRTVEQRGDLRSTVNLSDMDGFNLDQMDIGYKSKVHFFTITQLVIHQIHTGFGASITVTNLINSTIGNIQAAQGSKLWVYSTGPGNQLRLNAKGFHIQNNSLVTVMITTTTSIHMENLIVGKNAKLTIVVLAANESQASDGFNLGRVTVASNTECFIHTIHLLNKFEPGQNEKYHSGGFFCWSSGSLPPLELNGTVIKALPANATQNKINPEDHNETVPIDIILVSKIFLASSLTFFFLTTVVLAYLYAKEKKRNMK